MKRRDLFKGLAGTIIALAVKPLAGLIPEKSKLGFNGKMIKVGPPHASPGRIDMLNLDHWFRMEERASVDFYGDGAIGRGPGRLYDIAQMERDQREAWDNVQIKI